MGARSVWVLGLLLGCGGAPASPQTSGDTAYAADAPTSNASEPAETAWSHRASPADTQRAIALWTQRAEDDPAWWIRVAEARHFFAIVHARGASESATHAEAGLAAAVQALSHMAPELLRQLAMAGDSLDAATTDNAAALYWHARLQLVLATGRGYGQLLLVDDQVTRALAACERLLPDYDHFGAVVLLAQRAAHPLDPTQRDLEQARQRLDRAIAAEPEFLAHRVALAEHYAVIARDRDLFERELGAVQQSPQSNTAVVEQTRAHARAATLLSHVDELFE